MSVHSRHVGNVILVLDFGSQYTQLIARRVREMGVYCEILPSKTSAKSIRALSPKGIILSGGPETVTATKSLRAPDVVFQLGCPVLGICYGMQVMALQLGGTVHRALAGEFGHAELTILEATPLMSFRHAALDVWMSHGDVVTQLPPGFKTIAQTDIAPHAMIADVVRQFYGLQFHPEVTHTACGQEILSRFVQVVCECRATWTVPEIIEHSIAQIRNTVGNERVLVALSGGVDSAVAATLIHQAIGRQLVCVFVDTGLLRLHEKQAARAIFSKHLHMRVIYVDAQNRFLSALRGVADPEKKRKIVGREFIRIFEAEAKRLKIRWLGQGTIYPDVIESAKTKTGHSHVIKTHHNVGGLPLKMKLGLIEPLRELFKDEVRKLGIALGLPPSLIDRHPFPGPGLALRVIGPVTKKAIAILQRVDHIFIEELRAYDQYDRVSQAFAVLTSVKAVGVKGDARHYGYVVALRAVTSVDFMTAQWADLPREFLARVSHRIVNEVHEIARVVYDITHKPPATIEWE